MSKREYFKQIAFAALVIGASLGLHFIVPKNKALLLVIAAAVFLLAAATYVDLLDSRRLRIDHGREILFMKKPEPGIALGEDRLRIKNLDCAVACAIDEIEFFDSDANLGLFRKTKASSIRLSRWGGSFKLGKAEIYCEMIRPFAMFL